MAVGRRHHFVRNRRLAAAMTGTYVAHKTKSKELPVCSFCFLRFAADGRPSRSDYVCDLVCHDDGHLRSAAVTHCCHSMVGALLISESSVRCSFQKVRCAAHFRMLGAVLISESSVRCSFQKARCAAHFRKLGAVLISESSVRCSFQKARCTAQK